MIQGWVIGALIAMSLVHVLLLGVALSRGGFEDVFETDPESYMTEDGLECPTCGTVNRPEYRYCRECVSSLPGSVATGQAAEQPSGRRTL